MNSHRRTDRALAKLQARFERTWDRDLGIPPRSRRWYYREAQRVPGGIRAAAEAALREAEHRLDLGPLTIAWMRAVRKLPQTMSVTEQKWNAVPRVNCIGWYDHNDPGRLVVQALRSPTEVAFVVGHEARHAWQHRVWGSDAVREEQRQAEFDADAFATEIRAWARAHAISSIALKGAMEPPAECR